jgi:hypothetical protein
LSLVYVDPASGPNDRIRRAVERAQVKEDDAVTFFGMAPSVTHLNMMGQKIIYKHALIPIQPFVNFMSLSPEARNTKLSRFITRTKRSGWLIVPSSVRPKMVHEMLDAYYYFDTTKRFQESGLQIVWLSYRQRDGERR